MTAKVWPVASVNAFSTTLNGSIDNAVTTITLTSVTGLSTSGGILVIDRVDGSGNSTPTLREYISFTGVSGLTITGVTRQVAGSTAQSHNTNAVVEEPISVTHWLDLQTHIFTEHTATGTHVLSTPTIASPRIFTNLNASGASGVISDFTVVRNLSVSGASITGAIPLYPVWVMPLNSSAATTSLGLPLQLPRAGNFEYFSIALRAPASSCSLVFDVNKNYTSIFEASTRPSILGGGTFVSTASLLTKVVARGDLISIDLDAGGNYSDATMVAGLI